MSTLAQPSPSQASRLLTCDVASSTSLAADMMSACMLAEPRISGSAAHITATLVSRMRIICQAVRGKEKGVCYFIERNSQGVQCWLQGSFLSANELQTATLTPGRLPTAASPAGNCCRAPHVSCNVPAPHRPGGRTADKPCPGCGHASPHSLATTHTPQTRHCTSPTASSPADGAR